MDSTDQAAAASTTTLTRLSAWVLTATSFWALTYADVHSGGADAHGEGQHHQHLLLLVLGACALTWASPLAQLAGTKAKPGFRLVNLFVGGTSAVVLQAFAWSCYALAVFGCAVALVNPQLRVRGVLVSLGILGFAAQTLIEMSISVFDDTAFAAPTPTTPSIILQQPHAWSFSKLALSLAALSLALAGFAVAIAADWFQVPFLETAWNVTMGMHLASFALSQFAMGCRLVEEERKILCRVFAFILLLCTLWLFFRLHAVASSTTTTTSTEQPIRGATFALGLIGFLTCLLSLFSQWMAKTTTTSSTAATASRLRRGSSGDVYSDAASSSSSLSSTVTVLLLPQQHQRVRKASLVYYLSALLAVVAVVARTQGMSVHAVALCLVGCVLAHVGTWLSSRAAGMELIQPLQGGATFVLGQGLGWMAFSIALAGLLIVTLNPDTLDFQRAADAHIFSVAMVAHVCLLGSEPFFKSDVAAMTIVEEETEEASGEHNDEQLRRGHRRRARRLTQNGADFYGNDVRLTGLLLASFFMLSIAELVSMALSLAAAAVFVGFARPPRTQRLLRRQHALAWVWTVALTCIQFVGVCLQYELVASSSSSSSSSSSESNSFITYNRLALSAMDFVAAAVRAVLVIWYSKQLSNQSLSKPEPPSGDELEDKEDSNDAKEWARLATLTNVPSVRAALLLLQKRRPRRSDDETMTKMAVFASLHLVLLLVNCRPTFVWGVLGAPACGLYMEAHHLRPLQFKPKLHYGHVAAWFVIGIALVAQWTTAQLDDSGGYVHQTSRLLGCASHVGLMMLFAIDPAYEEDMEAEEEKETPAVVVAERSTSPALGGVVVPSRKRQTVSWILNVSALVCFLGIDCYLLFAQAEAAAVGERDSVLLPLIVSAWLAVALSVPLAYFTTTTTSTTTTTTAAAPASQGAGICKVLGIALWTFSLFLILMLVGGGGGGSASSSAEATGGGSTDNSIVSSTLAYSQSAMASLLAQTLLSRNELVYFSQLAALVSSLAFVYMFLPSLRWFLDYPMWYYAYYFKSWAHSVSPDGQHPYKDVVVIRNQRFRGNGVMDVMSPQRRLQPASQDVHPPPILFMHGGAHLFCLREIFIHSMTPFSRAGLCLYAVEYPLSPEAKFPQALVTVLFALNHVLLHHCATGCCVRGEPAQRCNQCGISSPAPSAPPQGTPAVGGECRCCPHFCGTHEVQLLGDSAGGNLAALVCAVLTNPGLFHSIFANCAEYELLKTLEFPKVIRLGLIYGLLGKEVRDEQDERESTWNRLVGHVTSAGLDFLLAQYAEFDSQGPVPALLLNDFLKQQDPDDPVIKAFCPETLMVVGTRDPLLYANRVTFALLRERFPDYKVELMEIPGAFHGFHGLPPQWNFRWRVDALPTTRALVRLFTGAAAAAAEEEEEDEEGAAELGPIPVDVSPLIVFPVLFATLAAVAHLTVAGVTWTVTQLNNP